LKKFVWRHAERLSQFLTHLEISFKALEIQPEMEVTEVVAQS